MSYKAVAFDMDGTILNSQKEILPATLDVIEKIKDKGIQVILATGRHHTVVHPYHYQLQLDTPVICCNGTYLYDFKRQSYFDARPLSKVQAKKLLDLVNEYKIHTLIYTDKEVTYEVMEDHLAGMMDWIASLPPFLRPELKQVDDFMTLIDESDELFKFATSSHDIPALQAFSKAVDAIGDFECEWSWVNRVDIALKGNNKGNGLANWAKHANISIESIVAFGDNYNDLSMLHRSGLGVAMGNADEEIKAQADRVIGDNNSPSIAEELTRLFL